MTYYVPDYARIAAVVADVANNLERSRLSGGIRRKFTDGQIQLGEAYMDGLRILLQHCGPLIKEADEIKIRRAYNAAIVARERLDVDDAWKVQRFLDARKFKSLSKKTYLTTKRVSGRALDNSYQGRFCGTDPPAESPPATPDEFDVTDPPASPFTPEEPHETRPSAGTPPATPEEPDSPQPHEPFTDQDSHAAATSTKSECIQNTILTTLSPGAAGIGGPMDDVSETYSVIYDPHFASSSTSIASDYTERTVNDYNTRHNDFPRRKYPQCGPSHLRDPQDLTSLGVNDASLPETEMMDESPSSPLSDQPISPKSESVPESKPESSPHQGVESLPPGPSSDHLMTDGTQDGESVVSVCDVDVFGSDSESGEVD